MIGLGMIIVLRIYAHNGDLVHKILFEIGFICILLVLILIPAVQKLIIQVPYWCFQQGLFQLWERFRCVLMLGVVGK